MTASLRFDDGESRFPERRRGVAVSTCRSSCPQVICEDPVMGRLGVGRSWTTCPFPSKACTVHTGAVISSASSAATLESRPRFAAANSCRSGPASLSRAPRLLDPLTRAAAALLTAGPRAALCGATAAHLHGCECARLTRRSTSSVPYGRAARSEPGSSAHHSCFISEDQVQGSTACACSRSIVWSPTCCASCRGADARATPSPSSTRPCGWRDQTATSSASAVAARIWSRGRTPAAPCGHAACWDLWSARAESPPESWLRLLLIEHGFPLPEVNWAITDAGSGGSSPGSTWRGRGCASRSSTTGMRDPCRSGGTADAARAAELRRRRLDRRSGWPAADQRRALPRCSAALRAAFAKRGYTW